MNKQIPILKRIQPIKSTTGERIGVRMIGLKCNYNTTKRRRDMT